MDQSLNFKSHRDNKVETSEAEKIEGSLRKEGAEREMRKGGGRNPFFSVGECIFETVKKKKRESTSY